MTKVDLITGFLGAGKTTFLLRYAPYLTNRGMRIGILVYDHGSVNVDMPLLQALHSDRCEVEMMAGSCDAGCHWRRFRTKLISMGMCGFDRVLIEPSGIFDMDEYFDTLNDSPLDKWFEPGSVIAVVDAKLEHHLSREEDYFLASQAASAGCILLSRSQIATKAQTEDTLSHLEHATRAISGRSTVREKTLIKDWNSFTDADYRHFMSCGYTPADYIKIIAGSASSFQSLSFLDLTLSRSELTEKTQRLFQDASFGKILRVKGFFPEKHQWYQINATEKELHIENVSASRSALVVIGSKLNEDAINVLLTGKVPAHHIL